MGGAPASSGPGGPPHRPSVSVILCTRDRPESLRRSLRAILASTHREFELLVVDQSDDPRTRELTEGLRREDPRLRYAPDARRGLSRARNLGLAAAIGDLLVFTDDDCEPEPEWLARLVECLVDDPGAGAAFGAVVPAPYDARIGFIDGFLPPRRLRVTGRLGMRWGAAGANMALRRRAVEDAGSFDELLGAGGYFASSEEWDLAYRILRAGYALWHLPEARVVHHGLRDWRSASALARGTYVAIGAMYTKYVRRGDPGGAYLLLRQVWLAAGTVVRNGLRRRRPLGLGRLGRLLVGVWRSFELDIAPGRPLYRLRR
jgi:GT2 family glycosyltransferase